MPEGLTVLRTPKFQISLGLVFLLLINKERDTLFRVSHLPNELSIEGREANLFAKVRNVSAVHCKSLPVYSCQPPSPSHSLHLLPLLEIGKKRAILGGKRSWQAETAAPVNLGVVGADLVFSTTNYHPISLGSSGLRSVGRSLTTSPYSKNATSSEISKPSHSGRPKGRRDERSP